MNNNNSSMNDSFIKEAVYEKFKSDFANEVKEALLNEKEIWIGDIIIYAIHLHRDFSINMDFTA